MRLVDVDDKGLAILWEHELYNGFTYHQDTAYFGSFEGDAGCQWGLMFCDEGEAAEFARQVWRKGEKLGGGEHGSDAGSVASSGRSFSIKSLFGGKAKETLPGSPMKAPPSPSRSIRSQREETPRQQLNRVKEADIGDPIGFQHLGHIGFNPLTGVFDCQNIPANWQKFFKDSGIKKKDLEDKETAGFIAKFVESAENAKNELGKGGGEGSGGERRRIPPPPPVKTSKAPPPRPPIRKLDRAPPQEVQRPAEPSRTPIKGGATSSRSAVKQSSRETAPPPPPSFASFKAFQSEQQHTTPEPSPSPRPAPTKKAPDMPSLNEQLLSSIRQAALTDLRPVQRTESNLSNISTANSDAPGDAMASLLAKALQNRNRQVAHSDSEDGEDWS